MQSMILLSISLNRCPEFKGIETQGFALYQPRVRLNRCPEFKGIETLTDAAFGETEVLNRCPEFKGIETYFVRIPQRGIVIESMP